jgi:hypothetical protein
MHHGICDCISPVPPEPRVAISPDARFLRLIISPILVLLLYCLAAGSGLGAIGGAALLD